MALWHRRFSPETPKEISYQSISGKFRLPLHGLAEPRAKKYFSFFFSPIDGEKEGGRVTEQIFPISLFREVINI